VSAADAVKVEAVGRVVERLLRAIAVHDGVCPGVGDECKATIEVGPLAAELRAIVDAAVPTGKTAGEDAMIELGFWAAHHSKTAPREAVSGALAAELVLQFQDIGLTREFFLERCAATWDSLRVARDALEKAGLSDVVMSRYDVAEADDAIAAAAAEILDDLYGSGLEPDCGDTDCGACTAAPAAADGG